MNNATFLNTLFSYSKKQNDDYDAKVFIDVAREEIIEAESETKFGKETVDAILKSGVEDSDLANIAIWHYQKGIERYEQAITNLEQAKLFNISAKYLKYIELKMKKCLEKIQELFTQKLQTEILLVN